MPSTRRTSTKPPAGSEGGGVRVLKKYPNRRLYDTQSSSYITLADVKQMVLSGEDFEVRDAKDSADLTRSILLQIILEEESGGVPMFSTDMLSQIIRFYGHAMQGAMGAVLEQNLKAAAQMLESGNTGPLTAYAADAKAFANSLRARAEPFSLDAVTWDGSAAEAAGSASIFRSLCETMWSSA